MNDDRDQFVQQIQQIAQAIETKSQSPEIAQLRQPSLLSSNCTLRAHQLKGLSWLIALHSCGYNGILGDDMGLGKTLQTISYLAYCVGEQKQRGPFLIVAPLSIVQNWKNEFDRFCPSMRVTVYIGNQFEREEIQEEIIEHVRNDQSGDESDPELPFDVLVTSYDMILSDVDFLMRFKWRCVVVDEAHRLKNADSKLYQTLKQQFEMPRIILLTGTPVHNNIKELFALMHFILPNLFSDEDQFLSWFPMDAIMSGEGDTLNYFHQILRPFLLRRKKSEILNDLPAKAEHILYTTLSSMQRKYYKGVLTKDSSAFGSKNKRSLTNVLLNLRKCCNHPYLFEGAEPEPYVEGEHLVNNSGKMVLLDKLLRKLRDEGHKVLIFSQMTSMLDILQDYMHFRKYPYERLDGSVRGEERFSAIDNFSGDSDTFVFLLSTRAGGMGLNLVAADTVIFTDLDFNPQMDLQAQERIYRIGQKRDVTIYRLITQNTVEEVMLKRSFNKMALSMNAIEKGGFSSGKDETLATEDILQLIKYGLHKIVSDETSEADDADDRLKRMNIDEILNDKKTVSFGEMTNKSIGLDKDALDDKNEQEESERAAESLYLFEGKNYDTKKKTTKGKQSSRRSTPRENAITGSKSSDNEELSDYSDDDDEPPVRVYSLRKRKTDDTSRTSSKQKRTSGYKSLNIVIQEEDEYNDESDNELDNISDSIDLSQTTLLNAGRNINYVIGDATSPLDKSDGAKMIINCVSDRGSWARGGFCSAIINNLSNEPKDRYEEAGKNSDLSLGDAQMVSIPNDSHIYVINVVAQSYDRQSGKHGGIELSALQTAFNKVQFAAKEIGASVHMPRIGWGLPNFNWYGVERIIKKYLVNAGVPTYVYYYKRGGGSNSSSTPRSVKRVTRKMNSSPATVALTSASKPVTSPNVVPPVSNNNDQDIFEDVKFVLYDLEEAEAKQLKRIIIENGGSVTSPSVTAHVVISRKDRSTDKGLDNLLQGSSACLRHPEWVYQSVREQKCSLGDDM